jgi:hypothetical protein
VYYIVKLGDFYLEWSTIVDAPVNVFKSRERLKKYYMDQAGECFNESGFARKMALVDVYGTDSGVSIDVEKAVERTIRRNRAGSKESELTLDEIYRVYCLGEKLDEWSPFDKMVGPIDEGVPEESPGEKLARGDEIPNIPKKEVPENGYRAIYDFVITNFSTKVVTGEETTSEIVIKLLGKLLSNETCRQAVVKPWLVIVEWDDGYLYESGWDTQEEAERERDKLQYEFDACYHEGDTLCYQICEARKVVVK